jgi:hypothetical protein
VVVDTNVPVVSNGKTPHVDVRCVKACIDELTIIREKQRILVDNRGLIFGEYRRRLSPSGQPGVGDAFFKWLWENQGNSEHCIAIPITPSDEDGENFAEFPDDSDLTLFHRDDRKFVATALASGENPYVVNATDTDWWNYRKALKRHGIKIRFLCPESMAKER